MSNPANLLPPRQFHYKTREESLETNINKLVSEVNDYLETIHRQCRLYYDSSRKTLYVKNGKLLNSLCIGNDCYKFLDGMRAMAWVQGLK